ncbi:hypothetical protein NDU88_001637 [Pleurodeles waltl]|uniref:Uncharacterized protein n=1 Tax=Pleurodeles waltl TaxID=8319 RepID=A0AAV7NBD2_PLEWA|nr:hypothetical protein NDU88_001637 [Pleurodeles waltl]
MRGVPHAAASASGRGASVEGPEDRAPTRSYLNSMCGTFKRRLRLRVMAAVPSPLFRFLPVCRALTGRNSPEVSAGVSQCFCCQPTHIGAQQGTGF